MKLAFAKMMTLLPPQGCSLKLNMLLVDNQDFPNTGCQVHREQSLVKVHFKVINQVKPSIWKTSE